MKPCKTTLICIASIMLCIWSLHTSEQNNTPKSRVAPPDKPIVIYNEPHFHIEPHIHNENKHTIAPVQTVNNTSANRSQNTNSNKTHVVTSVSVSVHAWFQQQLINIKAFDPQPYKDRCKSFLSKHKYTIGFYTLCACYAGLYAKLILDNHYLNRIDLWATWRSDQTFEQLCEIPQQTLGRELVLEIQRRYRNTDNITDFINPLILFMNAIDQEIVRIKHYQTISTWIKRCYLLIIFPTNEQKIKKAQTLLQRVHFVKHVFLSWAAEYNFMNKYPVKHWIKGEINENG